MRAAVLADPHLIFHRLMPEGAAAVVAKWFCGSQFATKDFFGLIQEF